MRLFLPLFAGGSAAALDYHYAQRDHANAALRGVNTPLNQDSVNDDPDRMLQFFDFDQNTFVLAGIPLLPEVSQEFCSDEWIYHVTCTVMECPGLIHDCPRSMFFDPAQEPDLEGANGVPDGP